MIWPPAATRRPAALAAVFRALGEPTRLRLVSLIAAQPGAEACVCDLTGPVGLTRPTVSIISRCWCKPG
ncbi:ArsR/SmtB family transcription factor [Mycolicibacillus trivialis]|uniref:ArsR/SmtB family transcription factor n=1 Tax=Mycolicibacillus trivialis TaxID=1798 RepID=UPI0035586158